MHGVLSCRSPALSIEEVEAQMRAAAAAGGGGGRGGGAGGLRLVPKSVRRELQDAAAAEAAEKKLQEEVAVSVLSVCFWGEEKCGAVSCVRVHACRDMCVVADIHTTCHCHSSLLSCTLPHPSTPLHTNTAPV